MLGRLQRDRDAGTLAELARPHARAVHDDLGFDVALRRAHTGHGTALLQHVGDTHALAKRRTLLPRTFRKRHRDVDRVRPTVLLHVEAGEDVVGPRERKEVAHLRTGDLVHVHAAVPVEGRDAPIFLEPVGVGRDLDETDRLEPGRLAGLGFQPRVKVARVLAHLGRRLATSSRT